MTSRFWLGVAVLLALAPANARARQVAERVQSAPTTGTGVVVGQVIDGKDGKPIPGALVSVGGRGMRWRGAPLTPGDNGQQVLADNQGRFVLTRLAPGMVPITVTAEGYQEGTYGQSSPGGRGRALTLEAGEKRGDVSITLWRFAVISGSVLDEGGDPVVGATVRATRRMMNGPVTRFVGEFPAQTDDRGIYRIAGLPAGDYVVSLPSATTTMPASLATAAQALRASGNNTAYFELNNQMSRSGAPMAVVSGLRIGDVYLQPREGVAPAYATDAGVFVQPTIYFSGAALATEATAITVGAADERSNIDFRVRFVKGARVSGTVTGPDGAAANMAVLLLPTDYASFANDSHTQVATAVTSADGRFTFAGVPPGSYLLRVLQPGRSMQDGGAPTLFALMPVSVAEPEVSGLSVTLREGPRLSGRIAYEGTGPRAPASGQPPPVTVSLQAAGNTSFSSAINGPSNVQASGEFTTASVPPGQYFVTANASGWTLKSVMVNGRDASKFPLALDADDVTTAVVTFFDRPASLSGVVRNASGATEADAAVYIFPADFATVLRAGAVPRPLHVLRTGDRGTFVTGGLTPGEYLVVAVDESALGDLSDQARIIELIAPKATRVLLGGTEPELNLVIAR